MAELTPIHIVDDGAAWRTEAVVAVCGARGRAGQGFDFVDREDADIANCPRCRMVLRVPLVPVPPPRQLEPQDLWSVR